MTTPREIIEYLEGEYKLNENDMTQWMNKLREVKAKKEEDIPFTLKRLFKLFKGMESSGNNISEKEKVKYILKSLPTSYKKKITLNGNENAENLRTTIVNDINTWIYVDDVTQNGNDSDDPMDIDYAGKLGHKDRKNLKNKNNNKNFPKKGNPSKQNNKDKFNSNKYSNNNKFCEICEKGGHSTKECRYNPRNPKGLYNKYYIQDEQKYRNNYHPHYNGQNGRAVRYINLNNEYNENVSYDDIRPMFYKYYDPKSKGKYVDDDDSDEYHESEKSNCFINYDKEDVKNEVLIKNNITTRVENKLNLVKEIFYK